MMRRWAILGFAAAATLAGAAGLVVEGNAAFTAAEINVAAFPAGTLDVAAVERLYLKAGYLDVSYTADETTPGTTRLVIREGPAYRVANVDLANDSPLDRDAVRRYVTVDRGEPPSPPELHAALTALLQELAARGYLRAEAGYELTDAGAPARVNLRVWVRAGDKFTSGDIKFEGPTPAEEKALRGRLETRPGKPLGEAALARDLRAAMDYYRERGYPTAVAHFRRFELLVNYREVDFAVAVDAGALVTVRRVDITGNRRTKDAVIRRELRLAPGDPYDLARVRASVRRVYNLKYFEAEPRFTLADEAAGVMRLAVKERRTYHVTGALAYEPEGDGSDAALLGDMDVALANLGGTGREVRANYERLTEIQMDAGAEYYEPWIGGVDLFAQPSGKYRERVTYRKLESELSLGTHPALDLTVAGGGGFDRVWLRDASRKVKVFAWATYDSRDYFPNPRTGWQLYGRAELGVKEFLDDGFLTRVPRFTWDGWRFLPTARAQVLALRLRAVAFSTGRASWDELDTLGGRGDLRGFREEQFLTDRQALLTAEYRFLAGRDNRLFVFTDAAYRHRGAPAPADQGYNLGYGVGFRARTPVGTYGVDYGLAAGAGPLDGMLHITITEEF